jgi:hypothetical protein
VSSTIRRDIFSDEEADFKNVGFEFEELGPYYFDPGWKDSSIFAFAKGRLERQRGGLCEGYPEVRKHWLRQLTRFAEIGADGIEIRLQSHSSGVTDFTNYGFNAPIIEAYRNKFGLDTPLDSFDPIKMMRIRGEFLISFLEEAGKLLRKQDMKFLIQVHGFMERPSLDPTFHELGFWANPKVLPDWRNLVDLADEIVLKDYNFGKYDPKNADAIKNAVADTGKPFWIHCYLQQGHDWNQRFIQAVNADPLVAGILLYEVVWNKREKDGIIKVDGDSVTSTWRKQVSSHGIAATNE